MEGVPSPGFQEIFELNKMAANEPNSQNIRVSKMTYQIKLLNWKKSTCFLNLATAWW